MGFDDLLYLFTDPQKFLEVDIFGVIIISVLYLTLLFAIALYGHKRSRLGKSIVNHPIIYSLSLTVYCTVWTFYGSIGLAAKSGLDFIPVYLGPAILAPVWYILTRKIILISNHLRITSIADFISSRYGKNTFIGVLTTLIILIGIIPYISIQLKAIGFSLDILTQAMGSDLNPGVDAFYTDKVNYFTALLALFTILFGTRNLDPFERHEGLIAAIAFESIVKLISFIAAGIFLVYFAFDGFSDVFQKASEDEQIKELITLDREPSHYSHWFWVMVLSGFAIMFLPRQFHVSVVENTNISFTRQAAWLLPLYLFLICLFVLPLAVIGRLVMPLDTPYDTYLLSLPLHYNQSWLAILVYIGGFSAAASMVVVSVIAISIMVSNNLLMPFLLKTRTAKIEGFALPSQRLLEIRRLIIIIVLFLAYAFYVLISKGFPLVSIGLTSFAAVLQLAPAILGGLFWTKANKKGAIMGMIAGFTIWFMTLFIPLFAEAGVIDPTFLKEGYYGVSFLKPHNLFGIENVTPIANACMWSMIFNLGLFVILSLTTSQSIEEISQADIFKNIDKYNNDPELGIIKKAASVPQLKKVMVRYLGSHKTREVLQNYTGKVEASNDKIDNLASIEFINFVEKILAGAFGSASANIILESEITKENITPQKLLAILDQTKKIIEYSTELEEKTDKLQKATKELESANESLKKLDIMKAEFISTVTHELRTPITSIRSFSQILASKKDISEERKQEFIAIIVKECDRISRLINQVLEVEKLEQIQIQDATWSSINEAIQLAISRLTPLIEDQNIKLILTLAEKDYYVRINEDKLLQIFLNIVSNAIKFSDKKNGVISIECKAETQKTSLHIEIFNNGDHIPEIYADKIFQKFIQVKEGNLAKPEGSGLGLFITKKIVEQGGGNITFESRAQHGTTFKIQLPYLDK